MRLATLCCVAALLAGCGSDLGMCELKGGTYEARWTEVSGTCGGFPTTTLMVQDTAMPYFGAGGDCDTSLRERDACAIEFSGQCSVPQDDGGEFHIVFSGDTQYVDRGRAESTIRMDQDSTTVEGTCSSQYEVVWQRL